MSAEVLNDTAAVVDGRYIGERVPEHLFQYAGAAPGMGLIENGKNGIPSRFAKDVQVVECLLVCVELHDGRLFSFTPDQQDGGKSKQDAGNDPHIDQLKQLGLVLG